ncbi:hypothetical protein EVAR_6243_1 [Eumeta japonica]|uniref:Uncharacterized protein n=1 Tax=Eumeta variegata TaxID=151549 RepID=A0A4C1T936_EUMVA|nr:hypothetical protein EVAR_6243_1 [Eumeta japonica]
MPSVRGEALEENVVTTRCRQAANFSPRAHPCTDQSADNNDSDKEELSPIAVLSEIPSIRRQQTSTSEEAVAVHQLP